MSTSAYTQQLERINQILRDSVINGDELVKSINSYDWLGNGFYFWENNEERALQRAEYLASSI